MEIKYTENQPEELKRIASGEGEWRGSTWMFLTNWVYLPANYLLFKPHVYIV